VRRLIASLILLCASLATQAHAEPADIAATARSVVRVVLIGQEEDGDGPSLVGHGSGVAVAPDVILTNAHVIEAARQDDTIRIGVVPSQGKSGWFGRIIAFAPKSDLALVKLTERGSLPTATIFTGPLTDGADVVAVGYPGNVDVAQGLNIGDIVSPTSPVKTRGTLSSGRSSKSFETILHTAPIGAGNSGGPLLDPCGRVIGINSFGTLSDEGDSEFYFAVSDREVLRFLRAASINPLTTANACRSLADVDRAEADRLAGEKRTTEEGARTLAARQREAAEKAERAALFEVIAERDNLIALAMLALVLALGAGGAAYVLVDRGDARGAKIAGAASGLLVVGALVAFLLRPGFADIDRRTKQRVESAAAAPKQAAAGQNGAGQRLCTINPARSRVTVSNPADIELTWNDKGCANGKEQFARDGTGWARLSLSAGDDSATVTRFDPATGSYRAERFFLDLETLTKLRAEEAKSPLAASCGGDDAARRQGLAQTALTPLLPQTPNERLIYSCR